MQFLTEQQARQWCSQKGISLDARGLPDRSAFSGRSEDFAIPSDAGQRVVTVRQRFDAIATGPDLLIWVTEWGVWPSGERMHIFDRFRRSYDETRDIAHAPAHLLPSDEYEDGLSILTLAVLFLWDCYVLRASGDGFLFFSHDEYGSIAA